MRSKLNRIEVKFRSLKVDAFFLRAISLSLGCLHVPVGAFVGALGLLTGSIQDLDVTGVKGWLAIVVHSIPEQRRDEFAPHGYGSLGYSTDVLRLWC